MAYFHPMTIRSAPRALGRAVALVTLISLSATAVPAMADEDPAAPAEVVAPVEAVVPDETAPEAVVPAAEAPEPAEVVPPAPAPVPASAPAPAPAPAPAARVAAPVAKAAPVPGDPCFPGACIDNGTVRLGVNSTGALNVGPGVGVQFVPTGNDGTVGGTPYEGWGVADPGSGVSGGAIGPSGQDLTVTSFQTMATTATSVVTIGDPNNPTFRVTHAFYPSPSTPNLYVVKVTIKNLTDSTINQVLYRRVVDWDVEPTAFSELITIATGDAKAVAGTSNEGFNNANPLSPLSGVSGDFEDLGPGDQGAAFDLAFGPLSSGGLLEFFLYYGAAASEAAAKAALGEVGAEAYSFGQTNDGGATGAPNTFILGFSDIGGTPLFADPTPEPEPTPVDPAPVDGGSSGADPVDAGSDITPVSTTVAPQVSSVQTSAQLPATGASLGTDIAPVGLLLVALGAAFVIVGRRRGGLAV